VDKLQNVLYSRYVLPIRGMNTVSTLIHFLALHFFEPNTHIVHSLRRIKVTDQNCNELYSFRE
jgi:hypothetical protein